MDEDYLTDRAGQVSRRLMGQVEIGLRPVLGLELNGRPFAQASDLHLRNVAGSRYTTTLRMSNSVVSR